jgi:hypothetical protein
MDANNTWARDAVRKLLVRAALAIAAEFALLAQQRGKQ